MLTSTCLSVYSVAEIGQGGAGEERQESGGSLSEEADRRSPPVLTIGRGHSLVCGCGDGSNSVPFRADLVRCS